MAARQRAGSWGPVRQRQAGRTRAGWGATEAGTACAVSKQAEWGATGFMGFAWGLLPYIHAGRPAALPPGGARITSATWKACTAPPLVPTHRQALPSAARQKLAPCTKSACVVVVASDRLRGSCQAYRRLVPLSSQTCATRCSGRSRSSWVWGWGLPPAWVARGRTGTRWRSCVCWRQVGPPACRRRCPAPPGRARPRCMTPPSAPGCCPGRRPAGRMGHTRGQLSCLLQAWMWVQAMRTRHVVRTFGTFPHADRLTHPLDIRGAATGACQALHRGHLYHGAFATWGSVPRLHRAPCRAAVEIRRMHSHRHSGCARMPGPLCLKSTDCCAAARETA